MKFKEMIKDREVLDDVRDMLVIALAIVVFLAFLIVPRIINNSTRNFEYNLTSIYPQGDNVYQSSTSAGGGVSFPPTPEYSIMWPCDSYINQQHECISYMKDGEKVSCGKC
jgi:hypothetical protein